MGRIISKGVKGVREMWIDFCTEYSLFGYKKDFRVLILGLDAAGKTSILYRLKLNEIITTIPTIGFNVETVAFKNIQFTCWDVGGEDRIRTLWRHYYANTDALIYVIDSNDRFRLKEAFDELNKHILKEMQLKDVVLLIFLNKQDLDNAISLKEFKELFREEFNQLFDHNKLFHIQPCSVLQKEGLYEGLDWLKNILMMKLKMNSKDYYLLSTVWKFGWTTETHNIFPKYYRKMVWKVVLFSFKKHYLPEEIIRVILSYISVDQFKISSDDINGLVKRMYRLKSELKRLNIVNFDEEVNQ